MATLTFPRETVEYLPIAAELDGEATASYEVAVVLPSERPTVWTAAPYLISGLAPEMYAVYVRKQDNPETPVVQVGYIIIT